MGELLDFGVWMQKRQEQGDITEGNLLVVVVAIFQFMKYQSSEGTTK